MLVAFTVVIIAHGFVTGVLWHVQTVGKFGKGGRFNSRFVELLKAQ